MISVQVPPHFANPLPNFYPMDSSYLNGMTAFSKPAPLFAPMSELKHKTTPSKKRPSRAGTRSVSTLTAAQLERKRANDREAQRAIRQRTKDHIESLERRIRELTSTNDTSARLMQALQRNEELEQENAILRSRLGHACSTISEGAPLQTDMLSGPASPQRRLKLSTQVRAQSMPAVPRSVPNSAVNPLPQEPWNGTYSPVSSTADRSPSVADMSPVNWPTHGQNPMPSPVVSEAGPHDGSGQYGNFLVDNAGRAISYSPAADGMSAFHHGGVGSPPPQVQHHHHQGQQMSATMPSPAYTQFPATPTSFIATSPHEADPNMSLMQQSSSVEPQPIMYSMPTSVPNAQADA